MTPIRTDAVRFVRELYPRLREDDAAIERSRTYSCLTLDPLRRWTVRPYEYGGWRVGMTDIRAHDAWESGFGLDAGNVLPALRTWGLPEPAAWEVEQPSKPAMVYVIGQPDGGLVKIGRSNDVPRRLADIQRMSPVPLAVLWQTPGGAQLEAHLHRTFAGHRTYGEWFDFGDTDPIATIRAEAQQ